MGANIYQRKQIEGKLQIRTCIIKSACPEVRKTLTQLLHPFTEKFSKIMVFLLSPNFMDIPGTTIHKKQCNSL